MDENNRITDCSKIHEALDLLNEAAREKKIELTDMLTDRYAHIKKAVALEAQKVEHMAHDAVVESEKKIRDATAKVDSAVRRDPWPYVAGSAAVALLIGYLMGSKHK